MAKKDFYEVLGVNREADKAELKKAYRKKAMQYHPDKNPDDKAAEAKFKEVNEAYDTLKDEQKRAAYDRYGHAAFEGGRGSGGAGGHGGMGGSFDAGGFSDIFEEVFGDFMGGARAGAQQRNSARRGADLRYSLDITLEQAFKGTKVKIKVPSSVSCDSCHGTGAEGNSSPEGCPTCQGAGRVRAAQGFFTVERTCPTCQGAGKVIKNPCKTCAGSGQRRIEKKLDVMIPAGVEDGTRIRLAGEGEAGYRGGPSGDLFVFLRVKSHRFFKREGANIYCEVPVTMVTAAMGGQIEVPVLGGGKVNVTIPAGTQHGAQLRLKGKGMSILRSASRGDLYVLVQVETPVNLSAKQKDLLGAFVAEDKGNRNSPRSSGFFSKVKEFFDDLRE